MLVSQADLALRSLPAPRVRVERLQDDSIGRMFDFVPPTRPAFSDSSRPVTARFDLLRLCEMQKSADGPDDDTRRHRQAPLLPSPTRVPIERLDESEHAGVPIGWISGKPSSDESAQGSRYSRRIR